ncbi:hypothetical protein GCM10010207_82430 [Streptomyces atratus]|nr:hypothetical protein GCM10010207_82430 [Streptomyces atratus]
MVPPPSTIRRRTVHVAEDVEGNRPRGILRNALNGGKAAERLACLLRRLAADGQDELLAPVVPEFPVGVEVAGAGDGDLQRVLRQAGRDPVGAALLGVHQEAGVVGAQGAGADEDRVDGSTHGVDPVEVLRVGEDEPVLARPGV